MSSLDLRARVKVPGFPDIQAVIVAHDGNVNNGSWFTLRFFDGNGIVQERRHSRFSVEQENAMLEPAIQPVKSETAPIGDAQTVTFKPARLSPAVAAALAGAGLFMRRKKSSARATSPRRGATPSPTSTKRGRRAKTKSKMKKRK